MKKKILKRHLMLATCGIIFITSCQKEDIISSTNDQTTGTMPTFIEEGDKPRTSGTNSSPIELINFEGSTTNSEVIINWTTASETDSYCFEVERSQDGVNYTIVAQEFIPISASTVPKNYTAVDAFPLSGITYYRLKWVYTDYSYEIFNAVSVTH